MKCRELSMVERQIILKLRKLFRAIAEALGIVTQEFGMSWKRMKPQSDRQQDVYRSDNRSAKKVKAVDDRNIVTAVKNSKTSREDYQEPLQGRAEVSQFTV